MDLRQMRYFVRLSEHCNLASAAESLFMTPQALSKSIRLLEDELQVELFYRKYSRLALTDFGKMVKEEFGALLEHHAEMEKRISEFSGKYNATVRIAVSHGLMNPTFHDFFDQYSLKNPHPEIVFMEVPDLIAEQYLLDNVCDLAFAIGGSSPNWSEFESTLLQQYHLGAVVSHNHPCADMELISLEECCKYPILAKNDLYKTGVLIKNYATANGIQVQYALESPNELLWRMMISEGKGIGIGTTYFKYLQKKSPLKYIPFSDEDLTWEIFLISRRKSYQHPAIKKLIKHITDTKDHLFDPDANH